MHIETTLTSIKDEKVIEARSLQTAKGRLASKKMLLEGEEAISWSLNSPCPLLYVFIHDKQKQHPLVDKLRSRRIPLYFTTDGILKKISDTSYLIPFIGVASFALSDQSFPDDILVVLDHVHDFGNVGTIVRTAAAFGIHHFASTHAEFDFFYKKTIDASRGTVFSSHLSTFQSGQEAVQALKAKGYQIFVTTPHASVIQSFANLDGRPIALVFGNETEGASREIMEAADVKIQIPMSGNVESLNVGVAAGISLYEMKIKLVLAMLTKKIHASLGRHLYSASRWMRLIFDAKLKEVSPFNADQAILLMILKCDGSSTLSALAHDAGLSPKASSDQLIMPLIQAGFVIAEKEKLTLSEKGEEALAKVWNIHELSEKIVLEGISENEKQIFFQVLEKIQHNCAQIVPFS